MPEPASSKGTPGQALRAEPRLARLGNRRGGTRHLSRRYSRLVSALKLLLPGAALLLVITIGLWQNLFGDTSLGVLEQVSGSQVGDRLVSPRFVGTDARDRPFTIEADYADQISNDAAVVGFSNPRGELLIEDGFVDLSARSGRFDRQAERLMLEGDVGVRRSDGIVFNTQRLQVELTEERAWSDVPVDGSGSFGTIEAEGGVEILNAGDTVRFLGPARLVLDATDDGALP